MNPVCYELSIHIPEELKDLGSIILQTLGESNFVEGSLDCDVPLDYDPEFFQKDHYELMDVQSPIVIFSEDPRYLENLSSEFTHLFVATAGEGTQCRTFVKEFADQDWRSSWKASFKPVSIGNTFVILPPWEPIENWGSISHKIVIDPGMAFGTGQHETTQTCLQLASELKATPSRVLDVGTGSGILCIAAAKLGATFVVGNDIDEESVKIAKANAEANHENSLEFVTTMLPEIPYSNFDLIFANIQFRPLSLLMPDIQKKLNPEGILIVSGVLDAEFEDFYLQVIVPNGLKLNKKITLKDWVGLELSNELKT